MFQIYWVPCGVHKHDKKILIQNCIVTLPVLNVCLYVTNFLLQLCVFDAKWAVEVDVCLPHSCSLRHFACLSTICRSGACQKSSKATFFCLMYGMPAFLYTLYLFLWWATTGNGMQCTGPFGGQSSIADTWYSPGCPQMFPYFCIGASGVIPLLIVW